MANSQLKTADHFFAKDIEEVLSIFETTSIGLASKTAQRRLAEYGLNEIQQGKRINPFTIFFRQFKNLMVVVLFAAAGLSAYYRHLLDTAVILIVVFINSIIGFVQEYRAETAIAALKKLVVQKAKVRRDGQILEIAATAVVPGDIIIIEEGDKIPADARIITQKNLQVSESLLTGESLPVDKHTTTLPLQTALADRKNMLFSGTIAVRGSAEAVVIATGEETVLGNIAKDLQSVEKTTAHFQQKNSELVKQMSVIAFGVAVLTFVVGFFVRGVAMEEILPFALAALVSGIPESLPIIIIVVLSLSAHRMAKRNAIVRTLPSTETLGIVNVIITDKTGTLTQNKMTATEMALYKNDKMHKEKLLTIAKYCNNIRVHRQDGPDELLGDPTEAAFFSLAEKHEKDIPKLTKLEDFPFNQQLKVRASIVKTKAGFELFVVGAPESLISRSTLKQDDKQKIHKQISTMTTHAMRTIGFGYKKLSQKPDEITPDMIKDINWVGVVGLIDPPRPESANAVKQAQKAGIAVIMATGDHPETAIAIANLIGLKTNGRAYTATDVEDMTDSELLHAAKSIPIFARMTPDAKLRLARVLQKAGYTIAMTGDGVNDAPALKGADVGIAMGRGGTDVSREAADIILADDNFATIVAAIEEGRTQFRNIRRTSFFLITTNLAESASLLAFLLLGFPLPLLPKQILWLNIVGSGVTDVALATEGIHEDVLDSPPRSKDEKILNKSVIPLLIMLIITMTIAALGVFFIMLPQGEDKARTAVFIILSLMQVMNMFNMRSLKESIFKIGIFDNRNINLALIISILSLVVVLYVPALARLFEFVPPTMPEFILLAISSCVVLILGELSKRFYKPHFNGVRPQIIQK